MILASLLIAYCSEYRAPGPHKGLGAPRAAPAPAPAGRPASVRSCERVARGPGSWLLFRWPGRAWCRRFRASGTPRPGAAARASFRGLASRAGIRPRPARRFPAPVPAARRAVAAPAQASDRAELPAGDTPSGDLWGRSNRARAGLLGQERGLGFSDAWWSFCLA